jgi:hypothetical protein
MSTWPVTLPASPLINGYNEVDEDSRLVSDVDAGQRKIRNRYTANAKFITENYILTETQYIALMTFYRTTLSNGATPFTKQHPITETSMLYRFNAPINLNSVEYPYYSVTLSLEIIP